MSWTLFQEGKRRPPKNQGRALAWAIVVFVLCVGLLPFIVWGVVEDFAQGEPAAAVVFIAVAALLVWGIVAAVTAMVRVARARRAR